MKTRNTFLSLTLMLCLTTAIMGQTDDLKIFGYFQNNYSYINVYMGDARTFNANSFLMQQMNIFLQKNYGPQFSSFVNLQLTNSFSSQDSMGGFKIEEAWAKYSASSLFNVKAGILTPRFNNFNEIKDRTVLLPYIYRPIAYETYFFNQFGTSEFVPTTANLQVYGDIPVGGFSVNYTGFYGNSETSILNTNKSFWGPGQDPTVYKMVGGRIGAEIGNLQFGGSMTYDRKNMDIVNSGFGTAKYNLGFIPRTRYGAYLNYSLSGFELEAELIKVNYDVSQTNKDKMALIPGSPASFDKSFDHINLLYNICDNLAVYVGYDYLSGGENFFIQNGLNINNYGVSYAVINSIILKAEYAHQSQSNFLGNSMTRNDYLLGASISF